MKINVRFVGFVKELTGVYMTPVELGEQATVETLLNVLQLQYPGLQPHRDSLLVTIGDGFGTKDTRILAGADVSVIAEI